MHLLIIRFRLLRQQIALKAVTQSEQFERSTPYITAIDNSMPKIKQEWERDYAVIAEHASINLRSFDVTSAPIENLIREQERPITHIYICLDEDYLVLWAEIELSNQCTHIQIYLSFLQG